MELEFDEPTAALACVGIVEVASVVDAAVCPPLVAVLPPCVAADRKDACIDDIDDICSGESDVMGAKPAMSVFD